MPKTEEEAEQMVQLGEKMISLGLEAAASLSHPEREALKAVFTTIVIKMKVVNLPKYNFDFLFHNSYILLNLFLKAKRGMSSSSQTSNGHSDRGSSSGVGKRSQPTNSRSPSPPVKRERRSSRSPTRREGSSRSSWGESRGSRENRGSREERNGSREAGYGSRGEGGSRGSWSGRGEQSLEGRRGRDVY